MPVELRLTAAFGIAAIAAFALTPLARKLALRTSFLDRPAGYKGHARPTPYLGGLAVVSALALASALTGHLGRVWPLVLGAVTLCALGTLDDRRSVRPIYRVLAEAILAAGLWFAGLGWSVPSNEFLSLIVTTLWVVAVVNAFNLMDNMDGTAAACATASGLGIAGLAVSTGQYEVAALALAVSGACLGFLPFNLRSPARIFLGDGGSMPIGFLAGGLAMATSAAEPESGWVGLAALLLVGLPLTDTTLVTISRRRRGVSILTAGRDHLTHRLLARLGSARLVALALAAAQGSLAFLAIVGVQLGSVPLAWISAGCLFLAAATIVVLEDGALAFAGEDRSTSGSDVQTPRPAAGDALPVRAVAAGALGFACGMSPLFAGFYSFSVWAPIALGMIALLFALFVAGEARPGRAGLAALAGLMMLAMLALLSTTWAESANRALIEADRWILYAAFFGTTLVLIRADRVARTALMAAAAGVFVTTSYIVVVALAGDGPSLFQDGRLFEPLGYVNTQGLFMVLGFWPLIALAQYPRSGVLAALGAAGAAGMMSVAVLSQARGVAFAVVASVAAVMLFLPGRQRRAWLLLCVVAPVILLRAPLLDVYQSADGSAAGYENAIRDAALAALMAATMAGLAWGICSRLASRLSGDLVRRASAVGLGVLALGTLIVTVMQTPAIADRLESEARAFTKLDNAAGSNRFLSGGGNRFDYWRIAVREFADQPLVGVGAGNYTRDYFVQRRTREDIRQPHSIEFQTLAELGLLGATALTLFLLAVVAGSYRRASRRALDSSDRALLVAAVGIFSAWLSHSSVDWSHLVPGSTGLALIAAACLVSRPRSHGFPVESESLRRDAAPARVASTRALVGVAIAVAAVAVARPMLAEHYRGEGEETLARDPVNALSKADKSMSLNDQAMATQYLRAAAYARLGDYGRARATLLHATRLEPHNFVPWALLGDLAVRRGDLRLARASYTRAWRLNPRDPTLRQAASGSLESLRRSGSPR